MPQEVCAWQPAAGSRRPAAGSRRPAAGSRPPEAGGQRRPRRPAGGRRLPAAPSGRRFLIGGPKCRERRTLLLAWVRPAAAHEHYLCEREPSLGPCQDTIAGCSWPFADKGKVLCAILTFRTPWARHGFPTGPPEPRQDPTDPRRTPGGTVRPQLIGASPVWAASHSYRRRPWLLYEKDCLASN